MKSNKYQVSVSEDLIADLRRLGIDQHEVIRK
jgi:hypothetical protein